VSRYQRSTVPAKPAKERAEASGSSAGSGQTTVVVHPTGPVVRVARGNNITVVPVGAK
jgi:pilus assembly protein CpaB